VVERVAGQNVTWGEVLIGLGLAYFLFRELLHQACRSAHKRRLAEQEREP